MEDCMHTCPVSLLFIITIYHILIIQKLQDSRAYRVENMADYDRLREKIIELTYDPDPNYAYYPRAISESIWLSISDRSESSTVSTVKTERMFYYCQRTQKKKLQLS